jgi:hypothetical protein
LGKVLNARAIILDSGIRHHDCHSRNVILLGAAYDIPDLQVEIIDFNIAGVLEIEGNSRRLKNLKQKWPGELFSPIVYERGHTMNFF